MKGTGLELIDVRGDDIDQTRARANVDDVLVANPDVNCMVGFYSYNPPRMYEALQDAGKLGQITVVAFDEDPITLGAVAEGSFAGTVVQNPYEWGITSAHLIADYLNGDKSKHSGRRGHHHPGPDADQGQRQAVPGRLPEEARWRLSQPRWPAAGRPAAGFLAAAPCQLPRAMNAPAPPVAAVAGDRPSRS